MKRYLGIIATIAALFTSKCAFANEDVQANLEIGPGYRLDWEQFQINDSNNQIEFSSDTQNIHYVTLGGYFDLAWKNILLDVDAHHGWNVNKPEPFGILFENTRHATSANGSLGYQIDIINSSQPTLSLVPFLGFGFEQNLRKSEVSVLEQSDSIDLVKRTDFRNRERWIGPFVGAKWKISPAKKMNIETGYSFHLLDVYNKSVASMNTIDEEGIVVSKNTTVVRDKLANNQFGHKVKLAVNYEISDSWKLGLNSSFTDYLFRKDVVDGVDSTGDRKALATMLNASYQF